MIFDKKTMAAIAFGCVIGAATIFAPVIAQETVSDAHRENARKVMAELKLFNSFDQIIPTMAEQARALFVRNNPALAAEIEESATNAALTLIERRVELDNKVIDIWASRFSEEEIKAVADFFSSDAGKKFASQSGELLQESAVAAKEWGDTLSVDIIDMVRNDLEGKIKAAE